MARKKFGLGDNRDPLADNLDHNTGELYAALIGNATKWYANSVTGVAGNDGMLADTPFLTITAAVTAASDNDIIVIKGTFTETISTSKKLTFIGAGPTVDDAVWMESAPGDTLLTLTGTHCRVSGIRFRVPTTGGIAISMINSDYTIIENCHFQGRTGSYYGVYVAGGSQWQILHNTFEYLNTATYGCGILGHSSTAMPAGCEIAWNTFHSNLRHLKASLRQSFVHDNLFQSIGLKPDNTALTATVLCDVYGEIAGSQFNTVTRNMFQGTYSITAGYKPGTNDNWAGNQSDQISATGTTAEGMTYLVPA
jgi:hypothetical protein